jgi:hypothetical protein
VRPVEYGFDKKNVTWIIMSVFKELIININISHNLIINVNMTR